MKFSDTESIKISFERVCLVKRLDNSSKNNTIIQENIVMCDWMLQVKKRRRSFILSELLIFYFYYINLY